MSLTDPLIPLVADHLGPALCRAIFLTKTMTASAYTPEIAVKFCAAVAEGDKSIRAICKLPGMPSKAAVFRWLAENEEFRKLYELARDEQAETHVDEVVELADKAPATKSGVAKAKLQIYARIELAQKMKPRKYGKLLQLAGEGGGPVAIQTITRKIVRPNGTDA